ncbi:MAG TPA: TRAP transporter large permease [Succinivibrionaceae bacterium]|nr:TRAP transporter large permease [Succinivibrionaceae bacterium]
MELAVAALFLVLIAALVLGVPIIWSLALACVTSVALNPDLSFVIIAQRMFSGADSFSLLAVPAFMLAGDVMSNGGLSKRLIDFADALVGWIAGGVSIVAISACAFFAAISGSSMATTASIGAVMYPEMTKRGYPKDYSAAIQAIGGTLGVVIPPSVVFVIYGTVTGVSISQLLMAGIIPGIFCGLMLALYCCVVAKKRNFPKGSSFNSMNIWTAFRRAFWALMMPVIILGGIYASIFTPTEAAVVSVFYGIFVCCFIYREVNHKSLWKICQHTAIVTANLMGLVASASVFAYLVTMYNIPTLITEFFMGFCNTWIIFMLIINLIMIVAGMFLDNGSIILILGPILAPLAVSYGIDPVQFGLVVVFVLSMGQCTPPFGTCMFIACGISNRPVMGVAKALIGFIAVEIACALLFSYVPEFSLLIPQLLMR